MSWTVTPRGPEPEQVLMKSARTPLAILQTRACSSAVVRPTSTMTLTTISSPSRVEAGEFGHADDLFDVLLHGPEFAGLEEAEVDHEVDLGWRRD